MSNVTDKLNTCECCETTSLEPRHENRPGQPALRYRIGTHGAIMQRMLMRIARIESPDGDLAGTRPLSDLTTRTPEDPAIALLDAWATVADVLTFYQERLANEGFLRTALKRRSVLELARGIGYELSPGVAAGVFLAFSLDTSQGLPESALIPAGVKAQSIPASGEEKPQLFETTEAITAHTEWNAVPARLTEPQAPSFGDTSLYIEGVTSRIQPGDHILLVGDERKAWFGSEQWDVRKVQIVTIDAKNDRTFIAWDVGLGSIEPHVQPALKNAELVVFRQRAALFGHNAPDWRVLPKEIQDAYCDKVREDCTDWPEFKINVDDALVDLDADYPKILPGSWIALVEPDYIELYRAVDIDSITRTDYTLSTKATRIKVDIRENLRKFGLRETLVLGQSESLSMPERPIESVVSGSVLELAPLEVPFAEVQTLIVSGKIDEDDTDVVSEVAVVKAVSDHGDYLTVTLMDALANAYARSTFMVYGNVVPATHGEKTSEVLGGGDGSKKNQTYKLKKSPLTHVSAATANGVENTLAVRVNDVLWEDRSSLFDAGPSDPVYTVRINDAAEASLTFGDGVRGARLPTGQENVTATYRAGIGLVGEVGATQISLLMSRPYGVQSVVNPMSATGAANPETLDEARSNAPMTVLTLDRIVSLIDFENFAGAFAGIGKAQATRIFDGENYLVHVTIVGANGAAVPGSDPLFDHLSDAIDGARNPSVKVILESAEFVTFSVDATIQYDPASLPETILTEAESALLTTFAFGGRAFAMPVTAADVMEVLHGIDGLMAVDIDALYLDAGTGETNSVLPAYRARREDAGIRPAQLLLINPEGIHLNLMSARLL